MTAVPTRPVYLDHCATTPVDERVFEAMRPYFLEAFGNAASTSHGFGHAAAAAVLRARNQVASLLGVDVDDRTGAREIVFTSGATEANNLAIKGAVEANAEKGRHVVTQATEHKATLDTCAYLAERRGGDVTVLPVDRYGWVSAADVAAAIRPDTVLVSIMWANNETGTLMPIREIGAACRARGVLFHSDATQAVGKVPIDLSADPVDLLSLSAHKFYGPKGVGALFVRRRDPRARVAPQMHGGGHERGFRSGTLNVPGIVGLGMAAELCAAGLRDEAARTAGLRDRLEQRIAAAGGVSVNGHPTARLPFVTNLSFAGIRGDRLTGLLGDVAVSAGSACTSASLEASHVLRAMGVDPQLAAQSVRLSVGRSTTLEQVEYAAGRLVRAVTELREPPADI
ncbi:MAG: cysteine desulfurase IscS [Phycisphaerales bacterium]|nr:cysteine desulfurase IscS [Phycisphaerales bacterium]